MIKVIAGNKTEHIIQDHFPDGTLHIKDLPYQANTIVWFYENDAELFTLICLRKHYWQEEYIKLYLPYVPHARMDRVKHETENFSLKHFCETINWLNFSEVHILDPHSNVTSALLNNVYVENNEFLINYAINDIYKKTDKLIVFFPDEGAMKRYNDNNIPYAFGIKKRNWEDGKILDLDIMNKDLIKGNNILIIDDICSRGGTFYHSAKALKETGAANIYLCVTHCENIMPCGDMYNSGLIDHIYTTNSIYAGNSDERVTVIEL